MKGNPATLCPFGCDVKVVEGGPADFGRYHCPRCMRSTPALMIAQVSYARGFTAGRNSIDDPKLRAELEEANRKLILFSSRANSLLGYLSNDPESPGAKEAWARLQALVEGEFPEAPPELGLQEATREFETL